MPYVPHTQQDIKAMLAALKIKSIDELFSEIPSNLRINGLSGIPEGLTEMEVRNLMQLRANANKPLVNFVGAGAYEHYIPAVVWDIASRGEYATAYTPYQAEASQGTLQTIYEYQTMICRLMQTDVSNASMYDGASALGEAVLMAERLKKAAHSRVLIPRSLHPAYRKVLKTMTHSHGIELAEVPFDLKSGTTTIEALDQAADKDFDALVINQPNFFGVLEDVDELTDWAHKHGAVVIAAVNPMAMAMLKAPGQWGETGADIVVGDGQPLGIPLSFGGPFFGFMGCKKDFIRQLPGRIVGRTVDTEGKIGFCLSMQAREQHIRRAKATSNICTNQALVATAATIFMSLVGAEGMQRIAATSHVNAQTLFKGLAAIKGVEKVFANANSFHEFVVRFHKPVAEVMSKLAAAGIFGGYNLTPDYPELGNSMLICVTETKSEKEITTYLQKVEEIL